MHKAACNGSCQSAKLLLKAGANVNAQDWHGETPLHIILRNLNNIEKNVQFEMFNFLLQNGAQIDIRNYADRTPLHYGISNSSYEIIKNLLDRGAFIHTKDNYKRTPIMDAILQYRLSFIDVKNIKSQQDALEVIKLLIKYGAKIDDGLAIHDFMCLFYFDVAQEILQLLLDTGNININLQSQYDGETLLHKAIAGNLYDIVELLLKNNVQADILDDQGLNALYQVNTEAMYNFLRKFPQVKVTKNNDTFVKCEQYCNKPEIQFDDEGKTLLHHAVLADDYNQVESLIHSGANVHQHDIKDGWTPLHYAVYVNSLEMCRLLLDAGACINSKTNDGLTPLHFACFDKLFEIVELLISAGADLNSQDKRIAGSIRFVCRHVGGFTPLHYTVSVKSYEISQLLIDAGANIHSKANDGRTPLHLAYTDISMLRLLINAGVDVNCKDIEGLNVLHYALFSNKSESWSTIADLLVAAGANVNHKDKHGFSLLHTAVLLTLSDVKVPSFLKNSPGYSLSHDIINSNYYDRVQFLLKHGANINALDLYGKSALDHAQSKKMKKLFSQAKKNKK